MRSTRAQCGAKYRVSRVIILCPCNVREVQAGRLTDSTRVVLMVIVSAPNSILRIGLLAYLPSAYNHRNAIHRPAIAEYSANIVTRRYRQFVNSVLYSVRIYAVPAPSTCVTTQKQVLIHQYAPKEVLFVCNPQGAVFPTAPSGAHTEG